MIIAFFISKFARPLIKLVMCLGFALLSVVMTDFVVLKLYVGYTGVENLADLSEDYGMAMLLVVAYCVSFLIGCFYGNRLVSKIFSRKGDK